MIAINVEPGSPEWEQIRCGVVTMSHAAELLTGGKGITRMNYILDVASERLSGVPVERVQTRDMLRGIFLEKYALEAYQKASGIDVDPLGFVFRDESRRIGCSPDSVMGRAPNGAGGVEVKCPLPRAHMRSINREIDGKYKAQMQGQMWVMGLDWIEFVSFCPEFETFPLYRKRYARDEDFILRLADAAITAVEEVDEIAEMIRGFTTQPSVGPIRAKALRDLHTFEAAEDTVKL